MSLAMTKDDGRTAAEIAAEIAAHPEAKNLNQGELELLTEVLENHPTLSIEEALHHLREGGM
jgi:hypothetical protein